MNRKRKSLPFESIHASAVCPPPKTVIVLGAERSGTSMAAQILHAIGVPMAPRLDAMGQDPAFAQLHRLQNQASFNRDQVKRLIESRDTANLTWGWKFPGHVMPEFYNLARAPHFVVMFRDPLDMARRIQTAEDWRLAPALRRVSQQQAAVSDFIANTRCPVLVVGYEQSLAFSDQLITALADFSSVALTQTKMAAARSVIARGNPAYLKASSAPEVFCHVDVLGPTIVSGWARNRTAPEQRVTIRLSIDDQIIQSTTADTYRADLEATLKGDGKWAFSIPFPERLPDEQMHNLELAASSGQSFKTVLTTRLQKRGHI